MGREHDPDELLDALGGEPVDGLLDRRPGVLGAVGEPVPAGLERLEGAPERRHLAGGPLGQRGDPADGPVAALEVAELLGARRPPSPDVGVEALHVRGAGRGPVGHHDHPGRHRRGPPALSSWTSATRPVSTSGSVVGRTPWPRLKM